MVAITGTSLGYAGTIDEVQAKEYFQYVGISPYGVKNPTALAVSTTTGDRMLLVAAGTAWGFNIVDTLTAAVTVQLDAVASGSRWDLIVLRRDASAKTSIEVVKGSPSKVLPSLTTSTATHPDQPIALCRVEAGKTAVQQIVDLRIIPGTGHLHAFDELALNYVNKPGNEVRIGDDMWRRRLVGSVWSWEKEPKTIVQSGTRTVPTAGQVVRTFTVQLDPGRFTAPTVTVTTDSTTVIACVPGGVTANQFSFTISNKTEGVRMPNGDIRVRWIAVEG